MTPAKKAISMYPYKFNNYTPILLIGIALVTLLLMGVFIVVLKINYSFYPYIDAFASQIALIISIFIISIWYPIEINESNYKVSFKDIGVIICIGAVLFGITFVTINLIAESKSDIHYTWQLIIVEFISICILAPIIEEIIFRKIIFEGLVKFNKNIILATIYSSFLFSIYHLDLTKVIPTFILSVILCIILSRKKRIIYCILIHLTHNLISWIMIL